MLLSIILSFRNEEEVLPELIEQLRHVINPLAIDYELIFINDASTDASLELLTAFRGDDPRIKIINMSHIAIQHHNYSDTCIWILMKFQLSSYLLFCEY